MMKTTLRAKILVFFALLLTATMSFALPFNIIPKPGTSLPVTWSPGQTLFAYYTVINNTGSQRNNNYVRFLPPNVAQISSGGTFSDTCGTTFNLGPNGIASDSCTLQLKILGPVTPNDSDPSHHLFVCFPGGITCAGTNYPLDIAQTATALVSIAVTPLTSTLTIGSTAQLSATGTFTNGTTQNITNTVTWQSSAPGVATVSSTGLVTAVAGGTVNITATQAGVTSNADIVTVITVVSIALTPATASLFGGNTQQLTATATYSNASTANITSQVTTWTSAVPTNATVSSSGLVTVVNGLGTEPVNVTANFQGVTSTPFVITTTLTLYAACSTLNQIGDVTLGICNLNPANGTPTSCSTQLSDSGGMRSAVQSSVNANGSVSFTSSLLNNIIIGCPLSGNIPSTNCTYNMTVHGEAGLVMDNSFHGYVANGGQVMGCSTSGRTITCPNAQNALGTVENVNLNPAQTILYVASTGGDSFCPVSAGVIGTCTATTSSPGSSNSIAIDSLHGFAYIGTGYGFGAGSLNTCTLNATTGNITGCTATGSGLTLTAGISGLAIDPSQTYIYVSDVAAHSYVCTLNSAGTLTSTNCTGINLGGISACGVTGLSVK